MSKINVTKTFLPPFDEYDKFLKQIWGSGMVTNQGPLLKQLEAEVSSFLEVENFHFVANGTVALQLALRSLGVTEGEVITTPFSYVATTSAILWERCKPVFVDIEPGTFGIDAGKIEAAITPKTKAILAVHVFGYPCDIELIGQIAKKHNLKVIYDAAHAFGVLFNGQSLLSYGDISTCSFHATKIFHTVEGGCLITRDNEVSNKIELMKRFGHHGDDHSMLGINAKNSELHAAMGLANLPHLSEIIASRKHSSELYDSLLGIDKPTKDGFNYNYAYYPYVFESEQRLHDVIEKLHAKDIFPRRYFYPSLNTLPYIENGAGCPFSEDIASRIVCLPLYAGMDDEIIHNISGVVTS